MPKTSAALTHEREMIRRILDRLMKEESSLDALCKHAPRLVSVAANVARIEASLESGKEGDDLDALRKAIRELESTQTHEENPQW